MHPLSVVVTRMVRTFSMDKQTLRTSRDLQNQLSSQTLETTEERLDFVGSSIERVDARMKVTGGVTYSRDMKMPNMLFGRIKRCPYPHARVISIDASRAAAMAGVRAIITARDFPQRLGEDTPALTQEVLYAGQGAAAVAAETMELAESATEAIEVQYEELPAVFDPEEAMSAHPNAIITHPGEKTEAPNVGRHLALRLGDVKDGFAKSDLVVENRYTTSPESHFQMEPISFLAKPEPNGGLTIWGPCSGAHRLRVELARYLALDPHLVRVKIPLLGGYFGPKDEGHIAAVCSMLALRSGRPVKLDLSREECIIATAVRGASVIRIRDGVTKGGKILAREITAIYNGGAFGSLGNHLLNRSIIAAANVYSVPNMNVDSYRVYTNLPPSSPKRGPVGTQIVWAVESQMEVLAATLGLDPVKFRLANVMRDGDTNALGEKMESISPEASLLEVSHRIRLKEKAPAEGPWRRGKGVALAAKWSAGGIAQASVKVTETGKIVVSVDVVENGQGILTGITQLVATEFETDPSDVLMLSLVNDSDTAASGLATGATASRQMAIAGSAVLSACRDAKARIAKLASARLGCRTDDVAIRRRRIYVKSDPSRGMGLEELFTCVPLEGVPATDAAFVEDGDLVGHGTTLKRMGHLDPKTGRAVNGKVSPYYVTVAQAAEVLVNAETGQTKVVRVVAAMDCGKAISPTLVKGQIVGSVSMALNAALTEGLVLSGGRISNANLADYKLSSSVDAPLIEPIIMETPYASGPYGAKSAGEPSVLPAAAAVRNAIHDAVGVWVNDTPMTAERVLAAIREERKPKA